MPDGSSGAALFEWPTTAPDLAAPPPTELDPFLDAAARCFARHGIRRTSVQDVAAELRVNRTTVYRQVGTIEQQVRLLLARDLHRLLETLPGALSATTGPHVVVDLLAALVEFARAHPVLAKVLADEPELIGPFLVSEHDEVVSRVAVTLVPMLTAAMSSGVLAPRDPRVLAEWLVRLGISLILAPPRDLRAFLTELLVPALAPHEELR